MRTLVIRGRKATHNERANQCLFDYEGKVTKALYIYKAK